MGDHGRSEYLTSRFTNIEPKDIYKAEIAFDSRPYLDFVTGIIFGEKCMMQCSPVCCCSRLAP